MTDQTEIEWPREIWMAEREEYDQGVVTAVLSEHATIARFEGDTERDLVFHRYVDGDIYDSSEKYWRSRIQTEQARLVAAIAIERERCARIAETYALDAAADGDRFAGALVTAAEDIAEAIRGLGET